MKNYKFYPVLIMSVVSLIISIVTLCSFEDYSYDKISALISCFSFILSALSVLVAILIGWQIYNVISMRAIKEETIRSNNEAIFHSNNNLFITIGSLAEFYMVQYLDADMEKDPAKASVLHYGALLNKAMTMDMCVGFGKIELFNSAVSSANMIVDDIPMTDENKIAIYNIVSNIPTSWRTKEFIDFYNHFVPNEKSD